LDSGEVFGFDPERDAVLAIRLKLERLGKTAVLILVFPDVLHAQRSLTAMGNLVIGEGGYALIILERPAVEVVAGHVLKIAVDHPGRVIRLEGGRSVVGDKQG